MSCNVTFVMGVKFLDEILVISLSQVILDCNVTFIMGKEFLGEICVMFLSQVILDCANRNTFILLLYLYHIPLVSLSSLCSVCTGLENCGSLVANTTKN